MFTNMKLATKIGLGFAALIAIACALGGLAVFNMKQTEDIVQVLATQNVPEVNIANDIERSS
jgi:methyl-accepting chemotaxis protein